MGLGSDDSLPCAHLRTHTEAAQRRQSRQTEDSIFPQSHLSNMKPLSESEVTCGDARGGWPASLQHLHPSPPLAEQRMAPLPAAVPDSASRATIRSLAASGFFLSQAGGRKEGRANYLKTKQCHLFQEAATAWRLLPRRRGGSTGRVWSGLN